LKFGGQNWNIGSPKGIFGNTKYLEALCVKRYGCNCNLDKDQGSGCKKVAESGFIRTREFIGISVELRGLSMKWYDFQQIS
jgi:hypothetical protein